MIVQYLRDDGQVVHQSTLDADTLIVQCALQFAIEGSKVCCTVADDTDVLVLMHGAPEHSKYIFFQRL